MPLHLDTLCQSELSQAMFGRATHAILTAVASSVVQMMRKSVQVKGVLQDCACVWGCMGLHDIYFVL